MGVTRSGGGRIIDSGSILFLVFSVLVIAGFAIWITIIARRASRLTRASNVRLEADLSSAVAEVTGTTPKKVGVTTHDGAIMFEDELPPVDSAPVPVAEPAPVAEALEAPTPTAADIESRLETLADLHSRGVITDDELATARLKILAE